MANMSYCRFQNTLKDLQDCLEHMETDLTPDGDEFNARQALVELAILISEDYGWMVQDEASEAGEGEADSE